MGLVVEGALNGVWGAVVVVRVVVVNVRCGGCCVRGRREEGREGGREGEDREGGWVRDNHYS